MPPDAAPLLDAKGVDAGYGTMQVLWGVDLDVRAGETVLLLGANGAGKTTFLKSLVGLVEARHGSIRLGGIELTKMRSAGWNSHGVCAIGCQFCCQAGSLSNRALMLRQSPASKGAL